MADATTEFFEPAGGAWARTGAGEGHGHAPLRPQKRRRPPRALADHDHEGRRRLSHKNAKADCVVRADRALFDGIASGEANAMAAFLRGAVEIDGDRGLLLAFQRAFPGPPRKGA